jgi:hypothetical protein
MVTIEQRFAAIQEKACTVVTMATSELKKPIVYVSRAHVMAGVIRDTLRAMDQIEADAVASDFTDDWRHMRLTLAHAQTQFESVINGSGDLTSSLPACRPKSSRYWT